MTTTLPAPARRARATAVLLFAALLAPYAAAQDRDTVNFKDGKSETGQIRTEEFSGLTINPARGAARTIAWDEIASIQYAGSPEYTSARESLEGGRFEEARTHLEGLLADPRLRPVIKQNGLFLMAGVQQRLGDVDGAIKTYKDLVAAFPKSRWLMQIGEGLVACHVAKKDVAGATKALEDLQTAAIAGGVENTFTSGINVLKGRVQEEQGNHSGAAANYGLAEKATGVPSSIVHEARLGVGRCYVAMNRKPDAEAIFRALTRENASSTVLAGAWNGLADLMLEEARKGQDPEKFLDPLLAYMRGVVQYAPAPGEPTQEYKRSMKGTAEVFLFISQLEKNPDRKRVYADRARERQAQYQKEFPAGT